MAGIFPSPTGVPADETDGGYEPALTPIGGPALFYGRECQTMLYYWALNALTSEILAAVDRLGYAYNSNRVDNLGAALADILGNMQLSLTAALDDIADLEIDMTAAQAAISALQGAVGTLQTNVTLLGNDVDAIQLYLTELEASQVALDPPIGPYADVRAMLTALAGSLGAVPDGSIMGNNTGGPATPGPLTPAQVAALLPLAAGNKGLLPALSGVAAEYLGGDGAWHAFGAVVHGAVYLDQVGTDIRLIRAGSGGLLIQGQQQALPAAGLSLSSSGAVAGTEYYVYAWMNAGVMELGKTPKATGKSLDANGVWVITGQPGWTLVGQAYCRTNGAWTARSLYIDDRLSYFNRRLLVAQATCAGVVASSLSFSILSTAPNSGSFLTWDDDICYATAFGSVITSAAGGVSRGAPGVDTALNFGNLIGMQAYTSAVSCAVGGGGGQVLADGRHTALCVGVSSSGSNGTYSFTSYFLYRG